MDYLIRKTFGLLLFFVFIGIPGLLSFMIPKIDELLEQYKNSKTNRVCLILSGISSAILMIVILSLVELQSESYLEVYNFGALFIAIYVIGFIVLRYAKHE